MARKVPKLAVESTGAELSAPDDLTALQPDLPLVIGNRKLTIREYSFFESVEVAYKASALIADMADQLQVSALNYAGIRRLFGVHRDVVVALIAQSTAVDPEWILSLPPHDAEILTSTWFSVNASFFVHEAVVDLRERRAQRAAELTGSKSSSSSATQDSATSTSSSTSPKDS